jgi:TRAP-type uncharacterized transport system substrate-binding protein
MAITKIKPVEYEWKTDDLTMDVGFSAQQLDDLLTSTVTIGAQGSSYGAYTIANGNSNNWSYGSGSITSASGPQASLQVQGSATIDGDLKVGGVSFKETIDSINKRLAILVPDPAKLEHFEALQKAYKHYKTLEALCEIPKKEDK